MNRSSKLPVSSPKFTQYAIAAGAALGATAAANAQFVSPYALGAQSGNTYGDWTASITNVTNGSTSVNVASAPASLTLSAIANGAGAGIEQLDFLTVAQTPLVITYSLHTTLSNVNGGAAGLFYTTDGLTFNSLNAQAYSGTPASLSFNVANGATFGFRLTANYVSFGSTFTATISNFSAAIPEPGTSGLLAGCAAAGFVALMGVRKSRQRAG